MLSDPLPADPFSEPGLIAFENAAIRLGGRILLRNTNWTIWPGEQWAVVGANGAGKSSLVRALAGELPVVRGRFHHPPDMRRTVGYVSFERHRRLIAREEAMDDARWFSGDPDSLTTARHVFDSGEGSGTAEQAASRIGIRHLLDRAVRFLSTGEIRKVLIACALAEQPKILVLDEPFDGLDVASREHLTGIIRSLIRSGTQVVLVTHRRSELLPEMTHVILVAEGRVAALGPKEDVLPVWRKHCPVLHPPVRWEMDGSPRGRSAEENIAGDAEHREHSAAPEQSETGEGTDAATPLIEMNDVTVRFGEQIILNHLHWTVRPGEHWAVTGPNGAGKTTLLRLISGDHPQVYANHVRLFGRKRGTGESIWDVKRRIGIISSEFQIRYRKSIRALDVVLSGFFDSVGLYRRATAEQQQTARAWMNRLGLERLAQRRFDHLSYGEQRMVLLGRALVKSPRLLILDEPCQGLDRGNRLAVLGLIDHALSGGLKTATQLLYVTHHPDEMPRSITHLLRFLPGSDGGPCSIEMTERVHDADG